MGFLDDFRNTRRLRLLNRCVQIGLGLLLIGGIFYLCTHFFIRRDISVQHRYTLSPETLAYIEKISSPLTIYVTLSAHTKEPELKSLYQDIKGLLREYMFASNHYEAPKIFIEYIDPLITQNKTESLSARYGVPTENTLLIASDKRFEIIPLSDLYESEKGTIKAFTGEQAITSAIVRLIQPNAPICYFTTGQGEKSLEDVQPTMGLSELKLFLKSRGLITRTIDLSTSSIPADADLLVIAGPQIPFLPEALDKIRHYLEDKNGHVIILLSPQRKHGFDDLFYAWGILADNAVVIDNAPNAHLCGGDFIVRNFAPHPITDPLIDYQLTILTGLCSPVRPDPAALLDPNRIITPLMASSGNSWADRSYFTDQIAIFSTSQGDIPGPVPIACAIEKKTGSHLGLTIEGGRLIVFGTNDWISNHRLGIMGNHLLFWSACNWSLNRSAFSSMSPRMLGHYQLAISASELFHLVYILAIPACLFGILAILCYFLRRK